jgi:hypothetical protein
MLNKILKAETLSLKLHTGHSYLHMLRFACMLGMHIIYAYQFVCPPMLFNSRNRIQIKTKCEMSMMFLDQNFMFLPMVHLFLLCCESIIMYRKMDKTIDRNSACIQPSFSVYMTQLTGKPNAPFERSYNSGIETSLRVSICFIFLHDFCI